MYILEPYDNALSQILEVPTWRTNKRTGVRTKSIFGMQCRYNISEKFPIVTRRKIWPKSIFAELLWIISGSTNNKDLQKLGSNIWTPWVSKEFEKKHGYVEGALGPIYGFQLRHFGGVYGNGNNFFWETDNGDINYYVQYGSGGVDQLEQMIKKIKEDPSDRGIMFSLWNPAQMDKGRLRCCHYSYQVYIDEEKKMSGMLTQRSCDFPIGVPANIQFYSALTYMLAQQTGYIPHEFIHSCGDAHIYENQIESVENYLKSPIIDSPVLKLHKAKDIYSYTLQDFELENFECGPLIKIPVSV